MASAFSGFIRRTSSPSIRSAVKSSFRSPPLTKASSSTSSLPPSRSSNTVPRISFTRSSSELRCVQSLLPLHSAVVVARMTSCLSTNSRSCRTLSQGT